ncbi:MAG: hypothetical protein KatS3mg105_3738 [Gemmatales bacterium]|nr:MAG: hypothetical protein KatS3mg105_3738 [Gemmatales bacterium]
MGKQLVELVLPRLARPLNRQLKRFRSGQISEEEFTNDFDCLLRQQHAWLAQRGVSESRAAVAIHGAVLVLSSEGLRAEAEENGQPLEIVEYEAVREAAADVAENFGIDERKAYRAIARIVARYTD